MSLSFTPCKTYPSETVLIQKITLTDKKPTKDAEVNEKSFVRTNITRNQRNVVIPDENANINEIPQNDIDNLKSILVKSPNDANANVTNERKYPTISEISPEGWERDRTYDGCHIFRVKIEFLDFK